MNIFILKLKKFENFLSRNYKIICDGDNLTKINFSSSGKKEHFYKFIPEEESLRVFEKKTDKSFKTIPLKSIIKYCYGISSSNLRKKFKSMKSQQLKDPWLFFSFIMSDRSVDLYLEESKLCQWFYGLTYYLKKNKQKFKIISVNNFILTKMKLKLLHERKKT